METLQMMATTMKKWQYLLTQALFVDYNKIKGKTGDNKLKLVKSSPQIYENKPIG